MLRCSGLYVGTRDLRHGCTTSAPSLPRPSRITLASHARATVKSRAQKPGGTPSSEGLPPGAVVPAAQPVAGPMFQNLPTQDTDSSSGRSTNPSKPKGATNSNADSMPEPVGGATPHEFDKKPDNNSSNKSGTDVGSQPAVYEAPVEGAEQQQGTRTQLKGPGAEAQQEAALEELGSEQGGSSPAGGGAHGQ